MPDALRRRNSQRGVAAASQYTASGNAACSSAQVPMTRRSAPPASVTASVVSVATRPAPANSVGRYWPTLTAKATAQDSSSGRSSNGSLMRQKARQRDAPSASAARV